MPRRTIGLQFYVLNGQSQPAFFMITLHCSFQFTPFIIQQIIQTVILKRYLNFFRNSYKQLHMEKVILRIKPLPKETNTKKIREVMCKFQLNRVCVVGNIGYIELDGEIELQKLGGFYSELKIPELENADIQPIKEAFQWPLSPSESQSSFEDLTLPNRDKLFIIKNCDPTKTKNMTYSDIKDSIFLKFASINRILNAQSYIIVEILNDSERDMIQIQFVEGRVPKVGIDAKIQLIDESYDLKKLTIQWNQHEKQLQKIQSDVNIPLLIEERQNQYKYLHEESLPTLDKMTSMEQNFQIRNQKQNELIKVKAQNPIQMIQEQEQIHTEVHLSIVNNRNQQVLAVKQGNISGIKKEEINIFNVINKYEIIKTQCKGCESIKSSKLIIWVSILMWACYILIS